MTRVKAVLAEVNAAVRRQKKNIRCLKTVQEPVYEFDSEEEMVKTKEKNLADSVAKSKSVAKEIAAEKENAPALRRSKRKQSAADEPVKYADSTLEPESSKSVKNVKSKAKKPAAKAKKSVSAAKKNSSKNLNQTKLNFTQLSTIDEDCPNNSKDLKPTEPGKCSLRESFSSAIPEDSSHPPRAGTSKESEPDKQVLGVSFSSTVTEDSGYAASSRTSNELISDSIVVFNSPDPRSYPVTPISSENSILTCGSPPITYWMDLAEQRRIALEKALLENELLHDQVEVLEVENAQIKNLLREAEKMARILKGIME